MVVNWLRWELDRVFYIVVRGVYHEFEEANTTNYVI